MFAVGLGTPVGPGHTALISAVSWCSVPAQPEVQPLQCPCKSKLTDKLYGVLSSVERRCCRAQTRLGRRWDYRSETHHGFADLFLFWFSVGTVHPSHVYPPHALTAQAENMWDMGFKPGSRPLLHLPVWPQWVETSWASTKLVQLNRKSLLHLNNSCLRLTAKLITEAQTIMLVDTCHRGWVASTPTRVCYPRHKQKPSWLPKQVRFSLHSWQMEGGKEGIPVVINEHTWSRTFWNPLSTEYHSSLFWW